MLCQQSCDNHATRIWHKTYCTVCSLVRSADTAQPRKRSNVTRPFPICGWGLGTRLECHQTLSHLWVGSGNETSHAQSTAVSIRILRGHLLAARAFRKYQNVRGNTLSNTLAVTSKPSISDYWLGISCLCNLVHVASFLCQVSTNPAKLRRRRRELRPFFWGM